MQTNIKEKLAKLLARAKDGAGHATGATAEGAEREAQNAAEMLQRFLIQHNFDIADLELKGSKKPQVEEKGHDLGKAAFKWKLNLADALAEHYFCVSLTDHSKKQVVFAGRPDNVESLKALYVWIITQIADIAREERRKHYEETGEHIDPLRWQVNFGLGAVSRLRTRLQEVANKRAANVTETGLVVHHMAEVSDYLEEKYGYRKDGRETERDRKWRMQWEEKKRKDKELKEKDIEAYYAKYPWQRPLTPEQQKAADKKAEKESKRYWAREARRTGPAYRPMSEERIKQEEQAQDAKAAGRRGADRVNLEPFLGERKKAKGEMR